MAAGLSLPSALRAAAAALRQPESAARRPPRPHPRLPALSRGLLLRPAEVPGAVAGGSPAPQLAVGGLCKVFDVSPALSNRPVTGEGRQLLRAVDGVSFDIERGTALALVGEPGCGKSTVARCIVGLHKPSEGRIRFDGRLLAGMDEAREV